MTDPRCTVDALAEMTFVPMRLDAMSPAELQKRASGAFTTLAMSTRLLNLDADEIASFLVCTFPEDPTELIQIARENRVWLEGLAKVLGCVEARMLIALSQRAVKQ